MAFYCLRKIGFQGKKRLPGVSYSSPGENVLFDTWKMRVCPKLFIDSIN